MTKKEFAQLVQGKIVLLDGATGSNLQRAGMPAGICVEKWICENEEPLINLQNAYVEAGSQIVYASTFAANAVKLKEYGLESEVSEINKAAVAVTKKALTGRALTAGDITMTGQQLEPLGTLKLEQLIDAYKEQIKALEEGGADLLIVETMMSLQETRAALIAAKEVSDLPVMVTMSFGEDGRTLYGTDAKTAAVVLASLGADAVGVNCSAGPDKMLPVIESMRSVVSVPVIAKPNAGLPKLGTFGITEYDMEADEFAQHMKELVRAGASILGGCCGTTPEYIGAVSQAVKDMKPAQADQSQEADNYLTSERNTILWTEQCSVGTIGTEESDEINEDWDDEIYDTMYDAIDDLDGEADVLCINVDGCSGNREEIVRNVVREAVSYTSLPMMFQSKDVTVLEAALRAYPGRAAVKADGMNPEEVQPIAGKYGALIV